MKSEVGIKIHLRRKKNNCRSYLEDTQNFDGTEAERRTKESQKAAQQEHRPTVMCDGEPLKNCFLFRYLGSMFVADGSIETDVRRRIGIAQTRAGQLRHILGSAIIPMETSVKLYDVAVGSLIVHLRMRGMGSNGKNPKTSKRGEQQTPVTFHWKANKGRGKTSNDKL